MYTNPIEVQITVNHLKESILHVISDRQGHLSKVIEEQTLKAVQEFDFQREITNQVTYLLPLIIKDVLGKVVRDLLDYDDEVKNTIKKIIVERIKITLSE